MSFSASAQVIPGTAAGGGISKSPKDTEETDPVRITMSVSPATIAAYTGSATLTWSARNAVGCEYDGTEYGDIGSLTVGPYTASGSKALAIECWGIGDRQRASRSVTLTVTRAPAPIITASVSPALLRAGVDSLTVTWSAEYADYCSAGGNDSYPTGGTANLGTYSAGRHSLSFSCTGDGGTTPHPT